MKILIQTVDSPVSVSANSTKEQALQAFEKLLPKGVAILKELDKTVKNETLFQLAKHLALVYDLKCIAKTNKSYVAMLLSQHSLSVEKVKSKSGRNQPPLNFSSLMDVVAIPGKRTSKIYADLLDSVYTKISLKPRAFWKKFWIEFWNFAYKFDSKNTLVSGHLTSKDILSKSKVTLTVSAELKKLLKQKGPLVGKALDKFCSDVILAYGFRSKKIRSGWGGFIIQKNEQIDINLYDKLLKTITPNWDFSTEGGDEVEYSTEFVNQNLGLELSIYSVNKYSSSRKMLTSQKIGVKIIKI